MMKLATSLASLTLRATAIRVAASPGGRTFRRNTDTPLKPALALLNRHITQAVKKAYR